MNIVTRSRWSLVGQVALALVTLTVSSLDPMRGFAQESAIVKPIAEDAVAPAAGYEEVVARLRKAIRRELSDKSLPAFSIALTEGDRTVWAEGFGYVDPERKRPATAKTVYRVGSVSKLFTDLAVMQLVERGELALDAPINDYLPNFTPKNPFGTPITLRQLMSHQSGLVRESPVGNYFDATEPSLEATVASLNDTSLVYAPNTKTKYSNAGIAVVGNVLEHKSGAPFNQIMQEKIFRPIGLRHSRFERTPDVERESAVGWMWTYDGRRFEAPDFALGTAPAGNLYSSVLDLSKFAQAIMNEGRGEHGVLLQPGTLRQMILPQRTDAGEPNPFAIGFRVSDFDGHTKIGHGGAVYGFSTQLELLPQRKLGVAAVASLDCSNGVVQRLAEYALRLLLSRQDGRRLPDWEASDPIPPERAAQLAGHYRSEEGWIDVIDRGGRLFLRHGDTRREIRTAGDGLVVDDVLDYGPKISRVSADTLAIGKTHYTRVTESVPEDLPARWKGLIGEYGWDHNTLYILEDRGQLFALIEWFYYYPLKEVSENEFAFPDSGLYHGEKLIFRRDTQGDAQEVIAASVAFPRREIGATKGETFRITPIKPIDELRAAALQAEPPQEAGDFREAELVEVTKLDPTIRLDIRYASANNFTGSVFYKEPRAFLQRPAAEAVVRAHRRLQEHGLGLLIHDAYRPWHVTKMFWDATPSELKHFVANPANGSRHNRGCAVDLTLCDLETGEPITMVAGYDEFSPRSYPDYPGGTSRQRYYRELLRQTMEAEGFTIYEFEWWHFDHPDWKKYRIGNRTFSELP
jgi:CubicO group peptidase (beta-lactamase class C family)/D-alanyl-D-alanine dipeptidase